MTAFNVEAYTWLKEDPQDKTTLLLQDIRHHFLASAAHNSAYTPPTISQDVLFKAKTVDVAINVLWFLSLTFALIAALFATLVQQWLKHYSDLPQADAKHRASLRQTRFEALDRWNVPQIIIALGVLLQVALFLFLGGLLCLLWSINTPVAFSVTTAVAICALVCLFTAAAPTFSTTCPYKSPAAWAFRFLACHAPLLGFFSRILRCGIEAISQQFQLTFSGRLQANLKKCLLQMDALLLRLEDPSSIINYGAWLDAEVTALKNMDDFRVMYRIINWTVFTNRCHTIKDLLACFLNDTESFGAKHALSRWFAADSSMSTGEVDGLIKSKSADHYSILINESNLSVVKVLIPLACQQYIRADVFFWRTASVDWMHLALWTLAPARARMHNSDGWPDVVWTFFEQLSEPLKYADRITEFLALANGVIEETHDRRFLGGAFAYGTWIIVLEAQQAQQAIITDCLGAIADFGWILNLQDATLLAVPQHTSRRSEVTQSTQAHDRVLSDHLNRAFELAALAALELIARTDTSETHLRYTRQETVETIVSYFERAKIQEELAPRSRTSETHGLVLGIRLWSKTLGSLNRQAHCQEEAAEITEAYWSLVERGELSALVDTMFSITTDWKVLHGSG